MSELTECYADLAAVHEKYRAAHRDMAALRQRVAVLEEALRWYAESDRKECPKCGDSRLLEGLPRLYCGSCDWQEEDETAALRQRVAVLEEALRDARPVVANAAADPSISPWQTETRQAILAKVDQALATTEGK